MERSIQLGEWIKETYLLDELNPNRLLEKVNRYKCYIYNAL